MKNFISVILFLGLIVFVGISASISWYIGWSLVPVVLETCKNLNFNYFITGISLYVVEAGFIYLMYKINRPIISWYMNIKI